MGAHGSRFLEAESAWRALDRYAKHAPGCPADWAPGGGRCDCGLAAARTRLQEIAWQLLAACAKHHESCAALAGKPCDCGLEDARRRLRAVLQRQQPPDAA